MKVLTFALGALLTNTYICIDEASESCIVIDPGLDGDGIYKKITERGLTLTDILLTHGHFDHALGVKTLRDATGATVWVGAADESLLYLPERNCADLFFPKDFDYPSVHADRFIKTGDEIRLGANTFRVTETPGHTEVRKPLRANRSLRRQYDRAAGIASQDTDSFRRKKGTHRPRQFLYPVKREKEYRGYSL